MSAAKEAQPLGSRSGKRGYIRICTICGRELRGVGRRTKYCPECRRQLNNARARERKRLERARAKHHGNDAVRTIAALADAAGMSYGQYVARQK